MTDRVAYLHRLGWILGLALLASLLVAPASAQDVGPPYQRVRSCASMAEVDFDDGSVITGAVEQGSGENSSCLVTVRVPERINIAVALPNFNWNGRHQSNGGGVYEGVLFPPGMGEYPPESGLRDVGSGTDTGHQSALLTAEWAWSPAASNGQPYGNRYGMNISQINDFGFRAHHMQAVKAKELINIYYGRPHDYSYWNGCSSGGRAGLTQAMRYPDDHDGIVAGAPAINWTRFIPAEYHPAFVQTAAGGGHDLDCKRDVITTAAVAYCAGTYDGMTALTDPRHCDFVDNPAGLAALVGTETDCGAITEEDIEVARRIFQGPLGDADPHGDADGEGSHQVSWFGLSPNTPMGSLGNPATGGGFLVATDWLKWFVKKDPAWDVSRYTSYQEYIDDFYVSTTEWDYALGTNDPTLQEFRDSGGKVIINHGMADPLIFWQGTQDYYSRVVDAMPGDTFADRLDHTRQFARLFLAPDAGHCGGVAANQQHAIRNWVENGIAPDTLGGSALDETANLCMWPDVPQYTGSGDPEHGSNYLCVPPTAAPDPCPLRTGDDTVRRVAGDDPATVAVLLSSGCFSTAANAVLAREDDFADALAAAGLAGELDAPVLLTSRDALAAPVAGELQRLGVEQVVLVGGEAALSPAVAADVEALDMEVRRIGGPERFSTAGLVADAIVEAGGPVSEAIVALGVRPEGGDAWPDALAAGVLSATSRAPVLLTAPDLVPEPTHAALERLLEPGATILVAGGSDAVGDAAEAEVTAAGYETQRIAGDTRYGTAAAMAEEAIARGADGSHVVLATGESFGHALVGGPVAVEAGGVLLLTPADALDPDTRAFLEGHRDTIRAVTLLGGSATLSDGVEEEVRAIFESV